MYDTFTVFYVFKLPLSVFHAVGMSRQTHLILTYLPVIIIISVYDLEQAIFYDKCFIQALSFTYIARCKL